MSNPQSKDTVKLKGVRLSFPALFKARAFDDTQEPKFSAVLILDKKRDAAQIKMIQDAIQFVANEKAKGKIPAKNLLRDGKEKSDTDGYGPEIMFVSANSAKRVPVVDADLTPLAEDSGKPYAGCYVNAVVRLWYQDNKWGKRINGQLRAVQFVRDGEAFGDKGVEAEEVFEAESSEPAQEEVDTSLL